MDQDSNIEYVTPKTKVHKFSSLIQDRQLLIQVIKLDGTVLIYVNDIRQPSFNYLAMAMLTRFSDIPSTTSLLGPDAAHPGNSLAGRLTKKLKKPVYLSLNSDERVSGNLDLEKRIFAEIENYPENF